LIVCLPAGVSLIEIFFGSTIFFVRVVIFKSYQLAK
jgi:hypothetical protein